MAALPSLLILQWIPADQVSTLWKEPKFNTTATLVWSLLALGFLVLGAEIGLARWSRKPSTSAAPAEAVAADGADGADGPRTRVATVPEWQAVLAGRIGTVLGVLALLAYAGWAALAVSRGVSLASVKSLLAASDINNALELREQLAPVGGVTTSVQFAVPAVALLTAGALLRGRRLPWLVWALLACAAVRALVNSERLALLEVLIPLCFTAFALTSGRLWSRLAAWAPLLAPATMLLFFGIFERFRSWSFYAGVYPGSYVEFVFYRVAGYYVTAANNNALFYERFRGTLPAPYFSGPAVWEAPGVSSFASYQSWFGVDPSEAWMGQLADSNPEFNNYGTMLIWASELGIVAGLVLWLLFGVAMARVYRSARLGSLPGLVTFACVLVWMLELGRTMVFVEGRTTPVILGVLAFWFAVRLQGDLRRRREQLRLPAVTPVPPPASEPVGAGRAT